MFFNNVFIIKLNAFRKPLNVSSLSKLIKNYFVLI